MVVLGESTATFLGHALAEATRRENCAPEMEIINCGQPGSGLAHLEKRYEEAKQFGADSVVIVFGHNLYRVFPTDEATVRQMRWFSRSRMLWALFSLVKRPKQTNDEQENRLEVFLEKVRTESEAHGQRLVVSTMPQNLWYPPSALQDSYPMRFAEADYLAAREDLDRLLEILREPDTKQRSSLDHFQAGVALHRAGRVEESREYFWMALDQDGHRSIRAPRRVNETIRRLNRWEHVTVVDMESRVVATTPDRIPGWESFSSHCHLSSSRFPDEVRTFIDVLLGEHLDSGEGRACVFRRNPHELFDLLTRFSEPKVALPDWWTESALTLAVERWLESNPDEAIRQVEFFIASEHFARLPDERQGLVFASIAEALFHKGDAGRANELIEDALLAGGPRAYYRSALLRIRQGNISHAQSLLERASELSNGDPGVRVVLDALLFDLKISGRAVD